MDEAVLAPAMPLAAFDNSSKWHNFTMWTAQQLGMAVNISRYAPSLEDLARAGPRMVMKLGRLSTFFKYHPDEFGGLNYHTIPEATDANMFSTGGVPSAAAGHFVAGNAPTAAQSVAAAAIADRDAASVSRFSLEGARGIGSVFSYATSKWAVCCIAMAIILNRTHIFAATRRRLRLRWPIRFALHIIPIVLFVIQGRQLLQSIHCQTSPDFAELRWGNSSKSSDLMFSQNSVFLHGLSSHLLLGASDQESCLAVKMIPGESGDAADLRGSLSLLWPLFGSFCLSQFLETVSCAVQGRPVAAETGMTLFEHSLAFAEADAAISNQLGWSLFGSSGTANVTSATLGTNIAISRAMILKRVNTPPEVLLVALLSAMSHITSHLLGIFGLQAKFRLVSTGFWALSFMGSIVWSAISFSVEDPSSQGLLRFPTVCIISFIPHVLVLAGIFCCFSIYLLALTLSALAPPDGQSIGQRRTFRERFAQAHQNMQANVSLSDIRISLEMDFYTAMLRAGFGAITMASEAVYLNEDRRVNLRRHTWLEEERYQEIENLKMQWIGAGVPGSRYDSIGTIGLVPVKNGQLGASSGYSRERAAQKLPKTRTGERRRVRYGVGAAERSGRWLMAVEYIVHIVNLAVTAWAIAACRTLAIVGIRNPPRWLKQLGARPKAGRPENGRVRPEARGDERTSEWLVSSGRTIRIPRDDNVDVESHLRRLLRDAEDRSRPGVEPEVDNWLYDWWLKGGWWGNKDTSGDYVPEAAETEDDITSVISATDAAELSSQSGWESDPDDDQGYDDNDGQRTPTQRSPFASRESSPVMDHPMEMSSLVRLLNPRSPEERDEARALAAHLSSDRIMTRSSYRRFQQRQRAEVLGLPRQLPNDDFNSNSGHPRAAKLTPDEEAQLLELILLDRRLPGRTAGVPPTTAGPSAAAEGAGAGAAPPAAEGSSWASGGSGMGEEGPQCVVCQCAPRTIIVWPCRCLCLCDDCRVSLAMNNFDKCVCCRREVISFSRIYVP